MTVRHWSFVLQWSRVGINAALFLIATRFLSLAEIGAFATAFAPIRMTQGLHKAGICESVIILGRSQRRLDALFAVSVTSGLAVAMLLAALAIILHAPTLLALSAIPLLNGLGAVSEGILRQSLRLRALALRTMASQLVAATLALGLLFHGAGLWALVAFALANATLTAALSLHLARWRPMTLPRWRYQRLILPRTSQIAARDFLGGTLIPLAQLAVGLGLGLPAAGAFQIATRVLSLIDALALSPLRFIALPQLHGLRGSAFRAALGNQLRLTATVSVWIWAGTCIAAPQILALLTGPTHATATAPILIALSGFGLIPALAMPINQALTAQGHTRLMLARAALLLTLGALCVLPAMWFSPRMVAAALSIAALITTLWHLTHALPRLDLTLRDLSPICAPLAAGTLMLGLFALLPPLPLAAQIAIGSALYAVALTRPANWNTCLLYTSPSPRDVEESRMPSSA